MKKPKKTDIDKNNEMKEILKDLNSITSAQLKYADDSKKMFDEEDETKFYISIVFQNEACCGEFVDNFKEFMGIKDSDQIFINGHSLAEKLGKPIKASYVKKTVDINKIRNLQTINEVGIYEG